MFNYRNCAKNKKFLFQKINCYNFITISTFQYFHKIVYVIELHCTVIF
jgi:hypothetical protein